MPAADLDERWALYGSIMGARMNAVAASSSSAEAERRLAQPVPFADECQVLAFI